jgi:CheY-like chemotaxis protein
MSGCALCAHIRRGEYSSQVPVVLICQNTPESVQSFEQSGASKLLLKPIEPAKLLWTIGCLIDEELGRSKRVKLHDRVLCKKENQDHYCFSHDISNTGIQLESEIQLIIGSRITMQFVLPGSSLIETAGKVIRSIDGPEGNKRYGVKFIDLPASCHRAIDIYVVSMVTSRSSTQNISRPIQQNHSHISYQDLIV